jgi:hypothetical protein
MCDSTIEDPTMGNPKKMKLYEATKSFLKKINCLLAMAKNVINAQGLVH